MSWALVIICTEILIVIILLEHLRAKRNPIEQKPATEIDYILERIKTLEDQLSSVRISQGIIKKREVNL